MNDQSDIAEPLGDLPPEVMRAALHQMAEWVADYRETIGERRIVPGVEPGQVTATLGASIPESAEPLGDILRDLDEVVLPGIVHWGHPAFLGYFGSTSNGPALLGEIAAAALNVSAMTWRTSPAATEMETVVLRWIGELVGIPDAFTGIVYDTASVAVVHALAAARERALDDVRARGLTGREELPTLRVYASRQAHSSLDKAMILLGLGEGNVVRVATDDAYKMDVGALRQVMEEDARQGRRALAVIATIGTTTTASVDPVRAIAAECVSRGAWLHVDAAYGGAIGALPEARELLDGIELADSIVVNPHKWLFVPLDFSALYMRDPDALRRVFSLVPEYLRGDASGSAGAAVDYMDYGVQLGRRFRALKAWMVLRAFGREGIRARIREHRRLATLFAQYVEAAPHFQLAAPLTMAVVCFRFTPAGLDGEQCDQMNERIVEMVNASGEAYLTHSRLSGRTVMRVGFGNVLTTESHLRGVWNLIVQESHRLSAATIL